MIVGLENDASLYCSNNARILELSSNLDRSLFERLLDTSGNVLKNRIKLGRIQAKNHIEVFSRPVGKVWPTRMPNQKVDNNFLKRFSKFQFCYASCGNNCCNIPSPQILFGVNTLVRRSLIGKPLDIVWVGWCLLDRSLARRAPIPAPDAVGGKPRTRNKQGQAQNHDRPAENERQVTGHRRQACRQKTVGAVR